MNNMKELIRKAQMAQKLHDDLKKQVFEHEEYDGALKITTTGDYKITLDIDFVKLLADFDNDNDALNAVLQVALNNLIKKIKYEEQKIIAS